MYGWIEMGMDGRVHCGRDGGRDLWLERSMEELVESTMDRLMARCEKV